jgi:hypothetical protein
MFGVLQIDGRTTPKSTRWNIYRAALYYMWSPADVASDTRRVCTHQLCRSLRGCSLFVFVQEEKTKQTFAEPRCVAFSNFTFSDFNESSCES